MASHLFEPGAPVTFTAAADVTDGQLLIVTGNRAVSPSTADSTAWVGQAAFDAKAGEKVTVLLGGVQRLVASGTVAAGDLVSAAADGKVATAAAPEVGAVVGLALTGGTNVPVEIVPSR